MTPEIEKILGAAILAPSGENCQPWRFVVTGTSIELWNRPDRDQSPYNWGQRASYMANGAALENLSLMAGNLGYTPSIHYFPSVDENLVATITLSRGGISESIAKAIPDRCSNRKPYSTDTLTDEEKKHLREYEKSEFGRLYLIENRDEITHLATVGGANEEIMLSNDTLHAFFFSHVNWTKAEDDQKKIGFYIETLELPPPAKIAFKLMSKPSIMRLFRFFGFPKLIGRQNAAIYARCAAIGAIVANGYEPIHFVKAGRLLERIWLAATLLNLQVQPLTGILFLMLKVRAGDTSEFSRDQIDLIQSSHEIISTIFGQQEKVLFMFRIGHGASPSARSSRFTIEHALSEL